MSDKLTIQGRDIPVLTLAELPAYAREHGWLSWTLRTVDGRWVWVQVDADGNVVDNEAEAEQARLTVRQ